MQFGVHGAVISMLANAFCTVLMEDACVCIDKLLTSVLLQPHSE